MQSRITAGNAQISAYNTYNGLLTTLETAASQLRDGTAFQGVTANVANGTSTTAASVLSASAPPGAAPGSYAVQVLQLAPIPAIRWNSSACSSVAARQ